MVIYMLDDSKGDLLILRKFVERYGKELAGVEFEMHSFLKSEEMMKLYNQAEEKPYLIFLDIFMEGEDGISVAKELRAKGCDARLIFATSSDRHMMDAFEVYADGYLTKPFRYEDVKNAMDRMKVRFLNESKTLTVRSDRLDKQVRIADIQYVESANHCVELHLGDEIVRSNMALAEIAEMLEGEANFITCGRSFIINMNCIEEVTKETVEMIDGDSILIPVRLRKQIQLNFNSYKVGQ